MAKLLISINSFGNFAVGAEPVKVSLTDVLSEKICKLQTEASNAGLNQCQENKGDKAKFDVILTVHRR